MICPHCGKSVPGRPTAKQWQAFWLVYARDTKYTQAAAIMGIKVSTLKGHLRAVGRKDPVMMEGVRKSRKEIKQAKLLRWNDRMEGDIAKQF